MNIQVKVGLGKITMATFQIFLICSRLQKKEIECQENNSKKIDANY